MFHKYLIQIEILVLYEQIELVDFWLIIPDFLALFKHICPKFLDLLILVLDLTSSSLHRGLEHLFFHIEFVQSFSGLFSLLIHLLNTAVISFHQLKLQSSQSLTFERNFFLNYSILLFNLSKLFFDSPISLILRF